MSQSDFQGGCVRLDPETKKPECRALKTMQEVLSWKASAEQLLCRPSSPNLDFTRPTKPRTKPYTIICHDFKGGYLQDRYLQGGTKEDAYYFCRWECVDMFIYFSHHFVTVPPLGWIRAAHKHGTMILGTIITEWDDGAALWLTMLDSKDTVQQLVDNLVAICKCHGFDGWLVNIENKIEESQIPGLKQFVQLLTDESHQHLPGSKVLWYDSVTRTGELKWQDQLNEENSLFFDACDGIFLNYCWTPEKLAASQQMAVQKSRPFDVFVGIDVFGRGCPGGGGFNTREALEQAREHNLSAAIFAPGWVLESLGVTDFDDNDCRFWSKLHDLCPLSDVSGLPLSSAFCQGHGSAFFCLGQEATVRPWYNMSLQQRQPDRTRVYGFQDPSAEATQPSLNTCLSSAYLGGCSIKLSAHLTSPLQTVSFRLFSIKAMLDQTLYCSYTFKENSNSRCDTCLVLTLGSGLLTRQVIMGTAGEPPGELESLADPHSSAAKDKDEQEDGEPKAKRARVELSAMYVRPLTATELEPMKTSVWFHDLDESTGISTGNSRQEGAGWITRHFKIDTAILNPASSKKEESISVSVSLSVPSESLSCDCPTEGNNNSALHADIQRTSILLGHLQVFREQDLSLKAPEVKNITLSKLESFSFADTETCGNMTDSGFSTDRKENGAAAKFALGPYVLGWDMEGEEKVDYFNVYLTAGGAPCLVGHTATHSFITKIAAHFMEGNKVTITVQPVLSATGLPLLLSKCPSQVIVVPKGI